MAEELEARIAALLSRGDAAAAVEAVYRGYGPELLGYLAAVVRDRTLAEDLAGELYLRLLGAVRTFEGRSTMRAWAYRVARHLAIDALRAPSRRGVRLDTEAAQRLVADVRESTRRWQANEAKDALARVRAQLTPEEQGLLVLRLDRRLSWEEVADVLRESGDPVNAAAARQRFRALKEKLRRLLAGEGAI